MPYGSGKQGTLKANDYAWKHHAIYHTQKSRSNKNGWSRVITDSNREAEESTLKSRMNQYNKATLDGNNGIRHNAQLT